MPLESVALVSMPWPLAERPSIQLAALKAYLDRHFRNGIAVSACHPYLAVADLLGLKRYTVIASRTWLAEAVYAPLLFPEQAVKAQALIRRLWKRRMGPIPDLDELTMALAALHERTGLVGRLCASDVVGFSVCLGQLTASLYLAAAVKGRSPRVTIVFGGSSVSERLGRGLLEHFEVVDYVVNGEGERPFARLVEAMARGRAAPEPSDVPGVFGRSVDGRVLGGGRIQLTRLDDLPVPDFDAYFQELREFSNLRTILPQVPVETSRGCWWHRTRPGKSSTGCRFCNLNLQWRGYRSKSPGRVADEIDGLSRKYSTLRFAFMDNVLNPGRMGAMFEAVAGKDGDFDLFTELRAPVPRAVFSGMRRAGVRQVQVGIEALSTPLLKRMGKGTRAVDNVAVMKRCEEFDIENHSNLLLEFPGSDASDVAETLRVLDFVRIFRPLRTVRFWLGEGSPIAENPGAFGLSAVRNHPWYRAVFPGELAERLPLMVKTCRGDRERQRRLWGPVREAVRRWRRDHDAWKRRFPGAPLLGYSDGGNFLLLRDRTVSSGAPRTYRLKGMSRKLYLACDEPRPIADLFREFPSITEAKLRAFLEAMTKKRLMFEEGDCYLSLATHENIRRFCPRDRCDAPEGTRFH